MLKITTRYILERFASVMSRSSVLVIGGGPSGMMTVGGLKDHCDVKLYERASRTGGQWACVGDKTVDNEIKEKYGERHSR